MAWTFDMNGKPVWTGDGQPERTVTGSNRLPQVVDPRPQMAAVPQQRAPGPAWQGEPLQQPNAAEAAALLSGTRSNSPFMTAFSLPGLSSAPLPAMPEGARPPMMETERPPSPTPFAESHGFPDITRPASFTPSLPPAQIPPVLVDAQRLPLRPIVEGVTMRRGAPGSGEFGERQDLTPGAVTRFDPIGVPEATRKGLIYAVPLPEKGPLTVETPAERGLVDAMRLTRDRRMEMTSDDAQAMRQGFRDRSEAGGMASAMRATGRAGASKDIVAQILGERRAGADSERRMREARVTPQVREGAVYDPLTGVSEVPQRGGTVRPTRWSEYTPKELGDMVNDAVKSMMPEGDSKAFQTALMQAGNDDTKKQAVYKQFSARPTPAQELILNTAMNELRNREGSVVEKAQAGGAKQAQKPAYKEGQSGVFNGKPYVMKNGKWTPA